MLRETHLMKFFTQRDMVQKDAIIISVEDMGAETRRDPDMKEGQPPTMEEPTLNNQNSEQKTCQTSVTGKCP